MADPNGTGGLTFFGSSYTPAPVTFGGARTSPQTTVTLFDPATGNSVVFPITPTEIKASAAAVVYSFSEARRGGLSRPHGRRENTYTFTCRLPGVAMSNMPHVHDWQPPAVIIAQLDAWANTSTVAERTRLHFSVPVKGINQDVYLGQYDYAWSGAFGDAVLNVQLVEFRALEVDLMAIPQDTAPDQLPDPSTTDDQPEEPPTPNTYIVQPGDTLWLIAKQQLGDGGLWQQIYQANADTIGANPNSIAAGLQLVIPGGQDTGAEIDG